MKISKSEVAHVAKLARLSFNEKEMELFTDQLNQILLYMEKLNEVDTTDVKPTYHALDLTNVFHEDKVSSSLDIKKTLANAPQADKDMFVVPKVIKA
ncbi:MAG: Asp-tRNA(Asn)/Glu-tRNA(Gln) amidotransferase subunit GatC [Candidatus Desulfofervidaceae bacterium]|nr:Asp-tRNA(Asn)/Glu-tRNA(Gln) amidotransferase subunit GatC [Candidatus Desulfofervidaceae bacterium]MDL1970354.1 Asp-tRNA(Asn)/Glu-tRNA(Gln) amidotransferase subunit GatC [Candidatus Desulfofervidaceae bacterium]